MYIQKKNNVHLNCIENTLVRAQDVQLMYLHCASNIHVNVHYNQCIIKSTLNILQNVHLKKTMYILMNIQCTLVRAEYVQLCTFIVH
jgi:hypothetical protein